MMLEGAIGSWVGINYELSGVSPSSTFVPMGIYEDLEQSNMAQLAKYLY
jgi:hypothetical protein